MKYENVAVLIPCYNEEVTVGKVVRDFMTALPGSRIYVFDNNSSDDTAIRASEAGAVVIPSTRQGKGFVVRHMLTLIDADYYVMIDGDDTYPADSAPEMLNLAKKNGTDMLVGSRLGTFEKKSFRSLHQFGNRLITKLISFLFNCRVTDVLSGYRVFSRNFAKSIPLLSKGFEIETELTLQCLSKGFVLEETPIQYGVRPEGSVSKLNTYKDGLLIILTIFKIFKDYKPLYFFTFLSICLASLSILTGILPIMDYIKSSYVYHVPLAILASAIGILSVLSFGIGLILDAIVKYHNENFESMRKLIHSLENGKHQL